MKRIFYFFISIVALVSCNAQQQATHVDGMTSPDGTLVMEALLTQDGTL